MISNSGNTAAKNLGDFINKTKANGGYYFGRYEASYKDNMHYYSRKSTSTRENSSTELKDGMLWNFITQLDAATVARNSFNSSYCDSDLINSYSWDTSLIFMQKYSEYPTYSGLKAYYFGWGLRNTGETNIVTDKACNIYDMASNLSEWSTEYSNNLASELKGVCRGRRDTLAETCCVSCFWICNGYLFFVSVLF